MIHPETIDGVHKEATSTFELLSKTCDKEEEVLQGMNDDAPICDGVKMIRVFSNIGKPQFKGDGFYETDYYNLKCLIRQFQQFY